MYLTEFFIGIKHDFFFCKNIFLNIIWHEFDLYKTWCEHPDFGMFFYCFFFVKNNHVTNYLKIKNIFITLVFLRSPRHAKKVFNNNYCNLIFACINWKIDFLLLSGIIKNLYLFFFKHSCNYCSTEKTITVAYVWFLLVY